MPPAASLYCLLLFFVRSYLKRPEGDIVEISLVASSPALILLSSLLADDLHSHCSCIHNSNPLWIRVSCPPLMQIMDILGIGTEFTIPFIRSTCISNKRDFGDTATDHMTHNSMSRFMIRIKSLAPVVSWRLCLFTCCLPMAGLHLGIFQS